MNSNPARVILSAALVLASTLALADQVIVLKDGSRIQGEVVSMKHQTYEIRTRSLGLIKLDADQVSSIRSPDSPASVPRTDSSVPASAIQSLQGSLAADPGLMSKILRLQNDPEMQAVLSDPEIMRAVQSLDLDALSGNPKIKALMNNPTVRSIQAESR